LKKRPTDQSRTSAFFSGEIFRSNNNRFDAYQPLVDIELRRLIASSKANMAIAPNPAPAIGPGAGTLGPAKDPVIVGVELKTTLLPGNDLVFT